MSDEPRPEHLDQVRAIVYGTDDRWISGAYLPRSLAPTDGVPESADWVIQDGTQDHVMVHSETVRPLRLMGLDPERMREAARALARTVHAALPKIGTTISAPETGVVHDDRFNAVQVLTTPIPGEWSTSRIYSDPGGLTWQTYGREHDFGTDRMLEVIDSDDKVIATYAPGTWLSACYPALLESDAIRGGKSPEPVSEPT